MIKIQDFGFRIPDFGFRIPDFGFPAAMPYALCRYAPCRAGVFGKI